MEMYIMQISALTMLLKKLCSVFNYELGFQACFMVSLTVACWLVLWIILEL